MVLLLHANRELVKANKKLIKYPGILYKEAPSLYVCCSQRIKRVTEWWIKLMPLHSHKMFFFNFLIFFWKMLLGLQRSMLCLFMVCCFSLDHFLLCLLKTKQGFNNFWLITRSRHLIINIILVLKNLKEAWYNKNLSMKFL